MVIALVLALVGAIGWLAYLGIMIEYDADKVDMTTSRVTFREAGTAEKRSGLGVAFVGAGSYAMGHLLPNVIKQSGVSMTGVMTSSGSSSRTVGEKYNFEFLLTNGEKLKSQRLKELAEFNGINDIALVQIDQVLRIPPQ